MRKTIVIALLVGVACVAAGEDKDPVKEKLFVAKVAYDKEMRQVRKQIDEWFDKREESARKTGDKKAIDQLKEDRKAYEENGELPKSIPMLIQQKQTQAKKKLEAAYGEAMKAYLKAKKDDLAGALEKEWDEINGKIVREPSTSPNNKAIDLLALVKPKEHTVYGDWKMSKKSLIYTTDNTLYQGRLWFPYEPGEEYDFEVTIRRTDGEDSFSMGLVAGGRQVRAVVDGWPLDGYVAGFDLIDKRYVIVNATRVKGALLKPDKDNTILYTVRREKLEISVNGKAITSYKGDYDQLSLHSTCVVPNKKVLFICIGPKSSYQIDRAMLTPVKGTGTILK